MRTHIRYWASSSAWTPTLSPSAPSDRRTDDRIAGCDAARRAAARGKTAARRTQGVLDPRTAPPRDPDIGDRLTGPTRSRPFVGQHAGGGGPAGRRRTAAVLGVGGDTWARRACRRGRGPQRAVLPVGLRCAQPREYRAGHREKSRGDAGGGRYRLGRRRQDSSWSATAFSCPFDGPVDAERVIHIANDARASGADDIVLCDTLGQAIPSQVTRLVVRIRDETPPRRIVFHGHDTWGQGVANSLAAVTAGADVVDGALGGLGGCPFAPGASGNTATEDLLFVLRPPWAGPQGPRFHRRTVREPAHRTGGAEPIRAAQGVRSPATAFAWAAGPRAGQLL